MKSCTYCGKQYPDAATVCAVDGQPLKPVAGLQPAPQPEEKHSTLGIISFGISIAVGVLMLAVFTIAGILNQGRVQHGQSYPGQLIIGCSAIFLLAADVLAVGFGIAALCDKGKRRLFGILGLVFSSATNPRRDRTHCPEPHVYRQISTLTSSLNTFAASRYIRV